MISLSNINLTDFRKFLTYKGFKKVRTTGGHEMWSKENLPRPITLQTYKNPIPEFIIRNNLRLMEATAKELREFLEKKYK